ncbi:TetR/AcrR family transcriptional regulator [Loktanella sp. Alg231-35]|uniref:TetR/AcrR family transcriptional regulator n=1 Tax=Loktanella sp. Alg231-35 TaxID=1922220 RepID=UPI000D55A8FD|nr:TetR/AcrR family transcriptional regulator [Loktanella sp. Alg231-35]
MNDRDKKLIVAAHAVFSRYGISKTTMNDIAREAGVARQTLYNAYPNKEAILRTAVRVSAEETYVNVDAAWRDLTELSEKIEVFFQFGPLCWYDMVVASPEMGDLIDGIHCIAKDEMEEFAVLWKGRFEDLIKEHAKPGSAAYDDAAATADFLYSCGINAKLDAADRSVVQSRLAILKRSILALVAE